MKIKRIETLEQYKSIKKGDTILIEWGKVPYKSKKIMLYEIPKVQHECNEIICNTKLNTYFNYLMVLEGISNAKEVYLIEIESEGE